MKIFFSEYNLAGKNSQPSQAGALLRLESEGAFGVADIGPKPQFGDVALSFELKERGPLFKRAYELASEDLRARKAGVSLLQNKAVSNNILITGYKTPGTVTNATYKIKADNNFEALVQLAGVLPKVRLDFNSGLTTAEFEYFLQNLSADLKARIEYIEDPTVMTPEWEAWNKTVPLAYDLQQNAAYSKALARYRIVKPARQSLPAELENVIFTSAMDHPVGVAHGLRIAQRFSTREAGFLTLDLYEETRFNKFFTQFENNLNFSTQALNDTGIGMTAELDSVEWKPLA